MDAPRQDDGESLIETLLAIAILGIAVVALISGLGAAIASSSLHRDYTTSQLQVRGFSEALTRAAYVPCTAGVTFVPGTSLPPASYSSPPGFTPVASHTVTVRSVQYWTGSAFSATCPTGGDTGVQLIMLDAQRTGGRGMQTLGVTKRTPCATTDPLCS